jgi:hypothetical protein
MQKMSFLAQLNHYQELEVTYCAELPEFIHMVKSSPTEDFELFFDGDVAWTAELEDAAEALLQANLVYA